MGLPWILEKVRKLVLDMGDLTGLSTTEKTSVVTSINEVVSTKSTTTSYSATLLAAGWVGTAAPYTQTVAVPGVLATDNKGYADIELESITLYADRTAIREAWGVVEMVISANDSITASADEVPAVDIPLRLVVSR